MIVDNPVQVIANEVEPLKRLLRQIRLTAWHPAFRVRQTIGKNLPQITVPTLVVQAAGDPIVNPKGSRKVFEHISSTDKEYRAFSFDRHGILLGEGAEKVHRAIGNFLERVTDK